MLYENMVGVIGNTPLVKLRLTSQSVGTVYAKLELMNPFGMKDRVAKQTILTAKLSGELKDGMPIIESSSGTMACGVALVGRHLGHEVHIVTDPRIDSITYAKLVSLGCQVHIVKEMGKNGWQSARLERLYELMEEFPDAFWPRQYENPENPRAYQELAIEVMNDIKRVDILVGSVGSGGSLSGTASALKKFNPNLKVVAVDATGSVIFGQPDRPTRLQGGLGNSLVAQNVDFSVIDYVHWLNDEEAFASTLQLARNEHIFAGNSSGSVYMVACWLASQVSQDCHIVAIFPDRGDRYTDTIYNHQYREQKGLEELSIPKEPQYVDLNSVVTSWSYAKLMGVHPHDKKTHVR
ncbi:PLP-dependent cysteine synthase family protein [Thermoflavimicrobium daqui]|jgi:cysteine synthase A|uniref:Pyridoxal-5'-phosphate-dependent protein n=1 Tax=Thermoflavimicrobium daqui TaxID=2137476 RepID=A0A364K126_9BACL|nr:cysteine synthase family protein [Thermoflavimicrobium daqui]RAL21398.1 pyridoxal-5'-phosphate-dependent protein [Thermoflavimicrobium daqui]